MNRKNAVVGGIGLAVSLLASMGCNTGANSTQDELEGTMWRVESIGKQVLPPTVFMTVKFDKEGKMSAHGVCNSASGVYSSHKRRLDVKELKMTEKACDGIEWEENFWKWLNNSGEYAIDTTAATLNIHTEKGEMYLKETSQEALETFARNEKMGDVFWGMFEQLTSEKLHVYDDPQGHLDMLAYTYHGTAIPNSMWHFFEESEARDFKSSGAYALYKLAGDFFLVRVQGKYTTNTIALFHKEGDVLKRVETLSWSWKDEGITNDQDAWLIDMNKDGKFDIVLREIEVDSEMKINRDKITVLVQKDNAKFVPDEQIKVDKKDFTPEIFMSLLK